MTENELKMYVVLQPLIKKAMGEYQIEDYFYSSRYGLRLLVKIEYDEELVYYHLSNKINIIETTKIERFILIPQTIDAENHQRGLWGMLDWIKWRIADEGNQGNVCLYTYENSKKISFYGTSTEAILMALCHQEGVEI